ncbi:endolytic transglycosylase MltG [candidate division WOR-3 bacterium]|nr:endolytic transglycosylase MltG [candidate division WOR-3 bacterium]
MILLFILLANVVYHGLHGSTEASVESAETLAEVHGVEVGINIESGGNLTQVATELHAQGVIKHPFLFKIWARLTNNDRKIKAGYYRFKTPSSIRKVLRMLIEGKTAEIKVTIPEGAILGEIAWLFWKKGGVDKEEFLKLAFDTSYIKTFDIQAKSLEGFLFPATYFIPHKAKSRDVICEMVARFFQVFTPELKAQANSISFTLEEAVIFASIIEKEAVCDSEKPIIASVYHNRLRNKWALQCDATVQYILQEHKSRLTYKDVRTPSPYNTYLHPGLPPGAICSPGVRSIRAALWPAETNYYYFVARGNGKHIFSRNLKEHKLAKRKVRNKVVSSQ